MRVGSSKPRKVNVRIIAATNRNLAERVEKGLFRRDLYYRLNVAVVNIPPLRERPDDIQPLVTHFLNMFTSKYRKHMNLTPGLMEALRQYSWPGNVRELQNLMHSIVITKDHGPLSVKDLPRHMTGNENEELFFPDDGINYERPSRTSWPTSNAASSARLSRCTDPSKKSPRSSRSTAVPFSGSCIRRRMEE